MDAIDWLAAERDAYLEGYDCVVGIDEAGRGALAGPVVAAAVILPRLHIPEGVNDSKKLNAAQRTHCAETIRNSAVAVGVGIVEVAEIDRINILKATHAAMRLAVANLIPPVIPGIALIDGLPVRPFPIPSRAIVKGDATCASIAAASIIAKVTRDAILCDLGALHPEYGFDIHKGYGTPLHLERLRDYGASPQHRKTFSPVKEMLAEANPHCAQLSLEMQDGE